MIAEMKMLLWKDLRLSELCLLAGMMFVIGPYIPILYPYIHRYDFNLAWMISAVLSQLTIALVAGNIISFERADRSAAFLAYQGITRKKIITSKLIICSITFISIFVISFILSFWLELLRPGESHEMRLFQADFFATGVCFFGCCWLLSDLTTNSVTAIVFGLFPPLFIICGLGLTSSYLHWPHDDKAFAYWYIAFVTPTGLITLFAGTWHFLRSKES